MFKSIVDDVINPEIDTDYKWRTLNILLGSSKSYKTLVKQDVLYDGMLAETHGQRIQPYVKRCKETIKLFKRLYELILFLPDCFDKQSEFYLLRNLSIVLEFYNSNNIKRCFPEKSLFKNIIHRKQFQDFLKLIPQKIATKVQFEEVADEWFHSFPNNFFYTR